MGPVTPTQRCSSASAADAEPMVGTAPAETRWLLVEHAGPWGRRAVAESRLPEQVRIHLAALGEQGVRVQLIRRPGSAQAGEAAAAGTAGATVLWLDLAADPPVVRGDRLDDLADLVDLDPARLPVSEEPLLLVCTNGRRDVCCAEVGRPVAAALSARWPGATWETTHLGGHRFAGTLLVLPAGLLLGRVGGNEAVDVVEDVLDGRPSPSHTRGRAGRTPSVQAACAHVAAVSGLPAQVAVAVDERAAPGEADVRVVRVRTPDQGAAPARDVDVLVRAAAGAPRMLSCVDEAPRASTTWTCEVLGEVDAPTQDPVRGGAA